MRPRVPKCKACKFCEIAPKGNTYKKYRCNYTDREVSSLDIRTSPPWCHLLDHYSREWLQYNKPREATRKINQQGGRESEKNT